MHESHTFSLLNSRQAACTREFSKKNFTNALLAEHSQYSQKGIKCSRIAVLSLTVCHCSQESKRAKGVSETEVYNTSKKKNNLVVARWYRKRMCTCVHTISFRETRDSRFFRTAWCIRAHKLRVEFCESGENDEWEPPLDYSVSGGDGGRVKMCAVCECVYVE